MVVTIENVAKRAGVSAGTASRALRGHPQVSPDCVARVRAAASELGYVPLRDRTGRSRSRPLDGRQIAILMLGLDRALSALPSVADAIHGAEAALAEAGAHPLLVNASDPAAPPKSLRREKFDGIVAKAALQGDVIKALRSRVQATLHETPVVWMLGRPTGATGDAVDVDDEQVGVIAARSVLDQGHRHVAIVNPKADHLLFTIRIRAFRDVVERAGGSVQEFLPREPRESMFPLQPVMEVAQVQPLVDAAIDARCRRPGRRSASGPTALFCPADSIAALVYRAIATRGLVPGTDISVISCNHEQALSAGLWPTLATVDIHAERIGRTAVEQLARRLSGHFPEASVRIGITPTFVPGGSLARGPQPRRPARPRRR